MSISTTNTSATTRNFAFGDTDVNHMKINSGLEEVRETDTDDKRRSQLNDRARTSMFIENSDILNDQDYPKLYYHHSNMLWPATATRSSTTDDEITKDKRRYSDTKLLNSLHFENEFLVKDTRNEILSARQDTAANFERFDLNIRNIQEIDRDEQKVDDSYLNENGTKTPSREKQYIFKSLPNLGSS